jgi:hypothetical protein
MIEAPEFRQDARFPRLIELKVMEVSPSAEAGGQARAIRGHTVNVSRGGMCLLTNEPIPSPFVRCDLQLPNIPVPIPTLMQVRWSQQQGRNHLSGLQFVL